MRKLIIFTAPSGAGKTTIVRHLLTKFDSLAFSVSATTRPMRAYEVNGHDYYFMSPEKFQHLIQERAFVEWEEVYQGRFYGTLHSEVERLWADKKDVIFDIEVKGATNIKKQYPEETLAIFVKPPSLQILIERLKNRQTESIGDLQTRLDRVAEEMAYEKSFDAVIVNDNLAEALQRAEELVRSFISS